MHGIISLKEKSFQNDFLAIWTLMAEMQQEIHRFWIEKRTLQFLTPTSIHQTIKCTRISSSTTNYNSGKITAVPINQLLNLTVITINHKFDILSHQNIDHSRKLQSRILVLEKWQKISEMQITGVLLTPNRSLTKPKMGPVWCFINSAWIWEGSILSKSEGFRSNCWDFDCFLPQIFQSSSSSSSITSLRSSGMWIFPAPANFGDGNRVVRLRVRSTVRKRREKVRKVWLVIVFLLVGMGMFGFEIGGLYIYI